MSCPEVVRPEGGEADVWPKGGEAVLPNSGGGSGSGVEGGEGKYTSALLLVRTFLSAWNMWNRAECVGVDGRNGLRTYLRKRNGGMVRNE